VPRKQFARQAATFVKHVVPAAIKPVHTLWHEIIGFVFLAFAAIAGWKVVNSPADLGPIQMALVIFFIVVMAAYGVSSFRKARRISRS